MKMNRIAAAALAGIMLAAPVLAEDAAWTPPTVTQEEMDAVQLGERILMRGTEGDDVRLVQQRLYDLAYRRRRLCARFSVRISWRRWMAKSAGRPLPCFSATT